MMCEIRRSLYALTVCWKTIPGGETYHSVVDPGHHCLHREVSVSTHIYDCTDINTNNIHLNTLLNLKVHLLSSNLN